jgi:hypothetical protein
MKRLIAIFSAFLLVFLIYGLASAMPPDGTGGWADDGSTTSTDRDVVIDGSLRLGQYTVATLPSTLGAGDAGFRAEITDGDSATDCTTGGGSDVVTCRWTGSAWANAGDGVAAGSAEVQDEAFTDGNFNGDTSHGVSQDDFWDLWATLVTTYQAVPSEGAFDDGDKTKLDTIEESADVTDATNVAAAGAVMKEVNETDPSDSTWDGRLDSDAVAGESMTAADYGRPLYCKDTGSGTRWYFYDPDATNTDNVDLQPTALLLTAATKSAGDTISVTSGQGTFAHDGWTDSMLDYDNVGYAVFCTSTGVDITAPSGVGDVVKQIGTVVGYTSRHVFRISFDTGFEKNS